MREARLQEAATTLSRSLAPTLQPHHPSLTRHRLVMLCAKTIEPLQNGCWRRCHLSCWVQRTACWAVFPSMASPAAAMVVSSHSLLASFPRGMKFIKHTSIRSGNAISKTTFHTIKHIIPLFLQDPESCHEHTNAEKTEETTLVNLITLSF